MVTPMAVAWRPPSCRCHRRPAGARRRSRSPDRVRHADERGDVGVATVSGIKASAAAHDRDPAACVPRARRRLRSSRPPSACSRARRRAETSDDYHLRTASRIRAQSTTSRQRGQGLTRTPLERTSRIRSRPSSRLDGTGALCDFQGAARTSGSNPWRLRCARATTRSRSSAPPRPRPVACVRRKPGRGHALRTAGRASARAS